ncbi:hypothetical protein, partial [Nocardia brevicatena]|uniref:hypothetical protein n=1 Tax=Nocardia brevicatena TaxID=37327 RepID=UPI001C3F4821
MRPLVLGQSAVTAFAFPGLPGHQKTGDSGDARQRPISTLSGDDIYAVEYCTHRTGDRPNPKTYTNRTKSDRKSIAEVPPLAGYWICGCNGQACAPAGAPVSLITNKRKENGAC